MKYGYGKIKKTKKGLIKITDIDGKITMKKTPLKSKKKPRIGLLKDIK